MCEHNRRCFKRARWAASNLQVEAGQREQIPMRIPMVCCVANIDQTILACFRDIQLVSSTLPLHLLRGFLRWPTHGPLVPSLRSQPGCWRNHGHSRYPISVSSDSSEEQVHLVEILTMNRWPSASRFQIAKGWTACIERVQNVHSLQNKGTTFCGRHLSDN
jgi:hypothetical protein